MFEVTNLNFQEAEGDARALTFAAQNAKEASSQ
jgi:hypothetical protein